MTELEQQVAEIWSEVLSEPAAAIPAGTTFLDAGGDSLQATQLRGRLRERFGVELPLSDLFESLSVTAIAARIEQSRNRGGDDDTEIEEGAL